MAPVSSWARSLGGAFLSGDELSEYFNDDDDNTGDNQQFYQAQGYHHTPTARSRTTQNRTFFVTEIFSFEFHTFFSEILPEACSPLKLDHGQIFCSNGYRDGSRCTYRLEQNI